MTVFLKVIYAFQCEVCGRGTEDSTLVEGATSKEAAAGLASALPEKPAHWETHNRCGQWIDGYVQKQGGKREGKWWS